MNITSISLADQQQSQISLNPDIFSVEVRSFIVAQIVNWQLAKRRAGTHSTLTRSEVRGTTKKCKPQKEQGTRHGDKRAPIFRKGGITFGPKPRDYEYSLNKKVRALGLKMILADKFNSQALHVIKSTDIKSPKTKDMKELLSKMGLSHALFISDTFSDNFNKAINNIPLINKLPVQGLNVYDIIKHKQLVITESGLKAIEARLLNK